MNYFTSTINSAVQFLVFCTYCNKYVFLKSLEETVCPECRKINTLKTKD